MTKAELQKEFERIKKLYRDKFVVSQDIFDLWYELLCDLDPEMFHEAVSRHMRCSDFAPLPASIMKQYTEVKEEWQLIMKHTIDTFNQASDNYMVYGGIVKPSDVNVFKEVYLNDRPYPLRENIANAFIAGLRTYLDKHDKNAEDNHLPPFEDYIRGAR